MSQLFTSPEPNVQKGDFPLYSFSGRAHSVLFNGVKGEVGIGSAW